MKPHGRTIPLFLAASVLAGAVLRLWTVPRLSFSGDESWTLRWISAPALELLSKFEVGLSMHLYLLILKAWSVPFGTSELALKAPSLLLGILTIPAVYLLGRRLFDVHAALAAAAFTACSVPLIEFSRIARVYAILVPFAILLMALLLRALRDGRARDWIALGVANAVGLMLSGNTAYLMVVQGVVALVEAFRDPARRRVVLLWFTAGSLVALALAIAFYAAAIPSALRLASQWTGGTASRAAAAVAAWNHLYPGWPVVFLLLAAAGSYTAVRSRSIEGRMLIIWAWLPPLLFLAVGSRQPPHALARFLLPILPAHFLLAGWFLSAVMRHRIAAPAAALVLALAAALAAPAAREAIATEPAATRAAVRIIAEEARADDMVTARTDWQAWFFRRRSAAPVRDWTKLIERPDRDSYRRLIATAPRPAETPAAWAEQFDVRVAGGAGYRQDYIVLVSPQLENPGQRLDALEAWLRGAIEAVGQERGPASRRHAEQALLTLGLAQVAALRGDETAAEMLRAEADALMRRAETGQSKVR